MNISRYGQSEVPHWSLLFVGGETAFGPKFQVRIYIRFMRGYDSLPAVVCIDCVGLIFVLTVTEPPLS